MRKLKIEVVALIYLLLGLPLFGNPNEGFNVKKKNPTNVNTESLNATRIDGSKFSGKTLQSKIIKVPQQGKPIKFLNPLQLTGEIKLKKVAFSSETNLPSFIQTIPEPLRVKKAFIINKPASCFNYLNQLALILKVSNPDSQFILRDILTDTFSNTHFRLDQVYKGIPIHGASVMVHLDKNGQGTLFNGHYYAIKKDINTKPSITSENAILKAVDDLKIKGKSLDKTFINTQMADIEKPEASLIIYNKKSLADNYVLAYQVDIYSDDHHHWIYFIDASSGEVIYSLESTCAVDGSRTTTAMDLNSVTRSINTYQKGSTYYLLDVTKPMFDAANSVIPDDPKGAIMTIDMNNTFGKNQAFTYLTTTDNNWSNPTAVSAHYNAGFAYEYYRTKHNRNSIDGKGGTIYSIINVPDQQTGDALDNAFWSSRFMWYGNGNVAFKPLAGGLDVAGHEMTHGVVENTANLEYDGESGAINESLADIFGAMMDSSNWLIGEAVVNISVYPSGALRSLSDPHNGGSSLSDRGYQPKNMSEKYTGDEDNHGVHINSGISNYAFYLFAQAIGKEKAANVYYKALTDYLTKSSQFIDLRMAVIQAATDLFGSASNEVTQAGSAFDAVGITDGTGTNVTSTLPVNPGNEYILVYNTDSTDVNTLYRTNDELSLTESLTTTPFISRPSVTDDGSVAVFIANDHTLHAIHTASGTDPQEVVIQNQQIWANAVVSKDGNRIAAVTTGIDTTIWVYDFNTAVWAGFKLYNPSHTEGINAEGPLYADALEWDYTGENLVYDCFNSYKNTAGKNIEFWDVNFIHVWDNGTGFGNGTVSKLFSSIPDSVSIGNPAFSKNSPKIVAFDYINSGTSEYSILGCNIETNEVNKIIDNNTIGWPSYNKDDTRLGYTTYNIDNNLQTNYVGLNIDKMSSTGSATGIFANSKWAVYFATGVRDLNTDVKQIKGTANQNKLRCFPNPFGNYITLELNPEKNAKGRIEVINQFGQIVTVSDYKTDGSNLVKLNLSSLKAGYYIIRVISDTNISIGKVIKN